MIVMPTNNSSMHLGWLAGTYPGRIGWLLSPGGWKNPHPWMTYALDNGAFPAWTNKEEWDEKAGEMASLWDNFLKRKGVS